MQECRNAGMQECRNAGMQECENVRRSGIPQRQRVKEIVFLLVGYEII